MGVYYNPTKVQMVKGTKFESNMNDHKVDPIAYKKMVGTLIYLTNIRWNINFSISIVSWFIAQPKLSHLNVKKQNFKCLKGTTNYGIIFKKGNNIELGIFVDIDWVNNTKYIRSINGYFSKLEILRCHGVERSNLQ